MTTQFWRFSTDARRSTLAPFILRGLAICLMFGARHVFAQGSVGFSASGGIADGAFGGGPSDQKAFYGAGLSYTYGTATKASSFVASGGFQVYGYKLSGTGPAGNVSVFEYRTPVTLGGRLGNFGIGGYFDYRQSVLTQDGYDPGNLHALFYGPYVRIGLGPLGSVAGKFALEGRYLWGSGSHDGTSGAYFGADPNQTTNVDLKSPHDWRAGVSFAATPHFIVRAEYHDVNYSVDTTNLIDPHSLDYKVKLYGVTLGYVF